MNAQPHPQDALKPRELEVLRLMADGLGNDEIAAQLSVAVATVRWHNRQLYSKLGVHSRTLAVARAREQGLLQERPVRPVGHSKGGDAAASLAPLTNLPLQPTSFVGRQREIAKARQLLTATRLLTLTGPGGTGKTRLALQIAEAVVEYYADGVWFVPLADVQDPNLVSAAIASVLRLTEAPAEPLATTLVHHLQEKQMLLVIDNFEHLMEATPLLTQLLMATSRLKLLVTSREVLRLSGEQEYPVPPLTVPSLNGSSPAPATFEMAQGDSLEEMLQFEAVRLFVERARASLPDFAPGAEDARAVAQICVRLDGLPLAIELAAARIKLLSPRQMLARLEQGLDGLGHGPRDAPARQRTLHATIAWSYALLGAEEKQLLGYLAPFRGGWTLDAMEAVCAGALQARGLDVLNALVDKNLVQRAGDEGGESRFRMLESVRQYVWEQLAAQEIVELRRRHGGWFVQLAEHAAMGLQSVEAQHWYRRLLREEDNLHAALNTCLADAHCREMGLRFAGALAEYWRVRGNFREPLAWVEALLALVEATPTSLYARALMAAGMLAKLEHDFGAVAFYCRQALEISRAIGDREVEAIGLHFMAHVAQEEANYTQAEQLYATSVQLFQERGERWGETQVLNCWGDMQRQAGDYEAAVTTLSQALAQCRSLHNQRGLAATLCNLGHALCRLQQPERAAACFGEGLEISQALENHSLVCLCLCGFAGVALVAGSPERAAVLLGAATRWHHALGIELESPDRVDYEWMVAATREQLPPADFAAAWARGEQMSLEQAVAFALAKP